MMEIKKLLIGKFGGGAFSSRASVESFMQSYSLLGEVYKTENGYLVEIDSNSDFVQIEQRLYNPDVKSNYYTKYINNTDKVNILGKYKYRAYYNNYIYTNLRPDGMDQLLWWYIWKYNFKKTTIKSKSQLVHIADRLSKLLNVDIFINYENMSIKIEEKGYIPIQQRLKNATKEYLSNYAKELDSLAEKSKIEHIKDASLIYNYWEKEIKGKYSAEYYKTENAINITADLLMKEYKEICHSDDVALLAQKARKNKYFTT